MLEPMFFDPERPPTFGLDLALGAYYNEFLEYWEQQNVQDGGELSDKERARAATWIRIADALPESLHSLAVGERTAAALKAFVTEAGEPVATTQAEQVFLARVAPHIPVVRQAVQLGVAYEAVGTLLSVAQERVFTLLDLIAERKLSARATQYLDRATRLFLWGFDPESVAFSGAVLEAALKERVGQSDKRLIQSAIALGLFTPEQGERANALREERNHVVHQSPEARMDPEQAIRTLAELLDALFPPSVRSVPDSPAQT